MPSGAGVAFRHQRLSSRRCIRLLNLLPETEFCADLETTLYEVNLDTISDTREDTHYEALSYVWGSTVGTLPITCDSMTLLITPNCESALRHLRLKNRPRALWVDAICIDQERGEASVLERNAQVAMMGEIYSKATHTLCWLGPGNAFTDALMSRLERIGECPSQRGLQKLLHFDEKLREEGRLDRECSSLDTIFSHPWHSRIWTVQEVVYSQKCSIVCGKSRMVWAIYSRAAEYLLFDNEIEEVDMECSKSCVGIYIRNILRDYVRKQPSEPEHKEEGEDEGERDQRAFFLRSCLTDIKKLQATEPRDKIYGVHSIYRALGIPLPEIDYGMSIPRVYEGATVAVILCTGKLTILGDSCRIREDESFPSWVPDFSDREVEIFTPLGNIASEHTKLANVSWTDLNPVPGELRLRGRVVGVVKAMPKRLMAASTFAITAYQTNVPLVDDSANEQVLENMIEAVRFFRQTYNLLRANPIYCPDGNPEDILCEILNQASYSKPDEIFHDWLDILQYPDTTFDILVADNLVQRWKPKTKELADCAVIISALLTNSIHHQGQVYSGTPAILKLVPEFSASLYHKKLILVQWKPNTTALGTTISSAVAGDSVVLLQGADWPVVLRREGSRWSFIAPAFVTGISNEDTWKRSEAEGDMKEFILV